MVDYEKHFRMYCEENSLTINLSFDMPELTEFQYLVSGDEWTVVIR